jgi:hypothetical protein
MVATAVKVAVGKQGFKMLVGKLGSTRLTLIPPLNDYRFAPPARDSADKARSCVYPTKIESKQGFALPRQTGGSVVSGKDFTGRRWATLVHFGHRFTAVIFGRRRTLWRVGEKPDASVAFRGVKGDTNGPSPKARRPTSFASK